MLVNLPRNVCLPPVAVIDPSGHVDPPSPAEPDYLMDHGSRADHALGEPPSEPRPVEAEAEVEVEAEAEAEVEAEVEVEAALLTDLGRELDAVEAVLRRMDNSSFDRCEVCAGPIGIDRLLADPVAARCSQHS